MEVISWIDAAPLLLPLNITTLSMFGGTDHVPSPRQKVELDALIPLFRRVTGRKLAVPVAAPVSTGLVMVLFVSDCVAASKATVSEVTDGSVCCWPEVGPMAEETRAPENVSVLLCVLAPVKANTSARLICKARILVACAWLVDNQKNAASSRSNNVSDSTARKRVINSSSLLQKTIQEN